MEESPIKLGELLINVGILQWQQLNDAIQIAGETGLPIGRVLIMSGYLTDRALQAAVQVQALVRDKILEADVAYKAIQLVSRENITLDEALRRMGWTAQPRMKIVGLGELLINAELITQNQLDDALRTSQETGLPLGRVLVLIQAISDEMLSAVLTAQVLLRDNKISKDQAIQGLRASWRRRVSIEASLADQGFYSSSKQTVRLGELLILSGLVSECDLMNALEMGLITETPVGQVLIQSGFITQTVLDAALKLQEMVISGTLNALQAAEALCQIATRGASIQQAVAELGLLKSEPSAQIRLGEILKAAQIVTEDDIKKAAELSARNSALIGKMLLVTGMIDQTMLYASLRCQFLLREGFLNMEQAIMLLSRCHSHQISFDDALQELGLLVPSRS